MASYLLLYKSVFIPKLLFNCQTWTKISVKDVTNLSKCVNTTLKRFMNVPTSTPNCSLYLELCILPVKYEIFYRKLMFLKKILHKDIDNIVFQLYMIQKKTDEVNWYKEVMEIRSITNIDLSDKEIYDLTKNQWKTIVNNNVRRTAFDELMKEKCLKSKLSNLNYCFNNWNCKPYFNEFSCLQSRMIFRIRTFMLPIRSNFASSKTVFVCKLCKTENETQQHLFQCKYFKKPIAMMSFFDESIDNNDVDKIINRVSVTQHL